MFRNNKALFHKVGLLWLCFTGIHKFLKDGIVRVGGRSNSEILKQFNLRELTHSQNFRRTLPPHLRTAYNQVGTYILESTVQGHETQDKEVFSEIHILLNPLLFLI